MAKTSLSRVLRNDSPNFTRVEPYTPSLTFGNGSTGMTYTTRVGRMQVIGSLCHVTGYILLSAKGSSTGNATISLPMVAIGVTGLRQSAAVGFFDNINFTIAGVNLWVDAGASSLSVYDEAAALTATEFTNTSAIAFSISYIVDLAA